MNRSLSFAGRNGVRTLIVSMILAGAPAVAFAQKDASADVQQARALSRAFQSAAKRVEPSVVHITQLNQVQLVQRDIFGFMSRPTGRTQLQQTGLGSGFVVSPDGYILTNNHVVQSADQLVVRFLDQKELPAKVIGRDVATDLAVIKVEATGLNPVSFGDSDNLEVGEWVLAVGSPFGFSNSVTSGIVSAKGRSGIAGLQAYQDFIQTDAVINPGNSGGPLVDLDGKVVGVNSAIATRAGGFDGIAFTIPAGIAKSVMDSIIQSGRVTRGYLGVALPEDRPGTNGVNQAGEGVPIVQVTEGGPGERAGLKDGDTIVAYQGKPIQGMLGDRIRYLRTLIATSRPGSEVKLDVLRSNKRISLSATIGDQSREIAQAEGGLVVPELAAAVRNLTDAEKRELNLTGGVLVLTVDASGRADQAEVKPGDIITGFDGARISSADQLTRQASRADYKAKRVRINLIRDDPRGGLQQGYVEIP